MSEIVGRKQIYLFALCSRLFYLLLSTISNLIIPDHNSETFSIPYIAFEQFTTLDNILWIIFGGLLRWDAQHFLHIAINGYTYENNLPFFPLFPVIIKYIGLLVNNLFGLNIVTSLLLATFVLNTLLFMETSYVMYELTRTVFYDKVNRMANFSVFFFCISPATIFFLAPYSETVFSFCTFKGMLYYTQRKYFNSLIWFLISVGARANGIINAGYILHVIAYRVMLNKCRSITLLIKYFLYLILSVGTILLPYILYQLYTYKHFCLTKHNHTMIVREYAIKNHLLLAGQHSVWCNHTIPFSYRYIQEHYWNVGLLRYYSLKQIPNFCLAFPLVYFVFKYGGYYIFKHARLFLDPIAIYETRQTNVPSTCFVFFVHSIYLTIFAILNINVQVTTRLIASSCPVIYWIAAETFTTSCRRLDPKFKVYSFIRWIYEFNSNKYGNRIKLYFLLYSILGTILFSNNYPWT